jgi:hypothetical protein
VPFLNKAFRSKKPNTDQTVACHSGRATLVSVNIFIEPVARSGIIKLGFFFNEKRWGKLWLQN